MRSGVRVSETGVAESVRGGRVRGVESEERWEERVERYWRWVEMAVGVRARVDVVESEDMAWARRVMEEVKEWMEERRDWTLWV